MKTQWLQGIPKVWVHFGISWNSFICCRFSAAHISCSQILATNLNLTKHNSCTSLWQCSIFMPWLIVLRYNRPQRYDSAELMDVQMGYKRVANSYSTQIIFHIQRHIWFEILFQGHRDQDGCKWDAHSLLSFILCQALV